MANIPLCTQIVTCLKCLYCLLGKMSFYHQPEKLFTSFLEFTVPLFFKPKNSRWVCPLCHVSLMSSSWRWVRVAMCSPWLSWPHSCQLATVARWLWSVAWMLILRDGQVGWCPKAGDVGRYVCGIWALRREKSQSSGRGVLHLAKCPHQKRLLASGGR